MRKSVLLLLAIFPLLLSAQGIERTQRPFVNKVTATWCPPCGGWGWDLFEQLLDDNGSEALLMATHYSGTLESEAAVDIAANFGARSQPQFYVNGTRQSGSSSSVARARSETRDKVIANRAMQPVAGAQSTLVSLSTSTIAFNVDVEFFEAASGEYYVATYIIEDDVVASQANRSSTAVHKRVLRTHAGSSSFGLPIGSATITAGQTFSLTTSANWDSDWNAEKVRIATVIWKKEGDTYAYVNGAENIDFRASSSTTAVQEAVTELSSFSESGRLTTRYALNRSVQSVTIELINVAGNVVESLTKSDLSAGSHELAWTATTLPSGYYVVRLSTEAGHKSAPVFVQ